MQDTRPSWDAVELPTWPMCRSALSWSSEELAVAAGEVVHILTPRHDSITRDAPGHRQWHTFTLRVNQFELSEWPMLHLVTIKHFSVGEELSDSHVAALAWSPSGLGLYRRSVLTVLTSNLLLSFWETTGKLGEWKRTCIVNHHIHPDLPPDDSGHTRLKKRIRSFLWLPAIPDSDTARWNPPLLMIADDTYAISIYKVCKATKSAPSGWSFEVLARFQMSMATEAPHNNRPTSSLRATLLNTSPITRLESTDWVFKDAEREQGSLSAFVKIKVSFGVLTHHRYLSVDLQTLARMPSNTTVQGHDITLTIDESQPCEGLFVDQSPTVDLFESSIRGPQSDFNEEYDLGGKFLVRHWGAVYHPDRTKAAACISLHPSEMIESCLPSKQRTTVVFTIFKSSTAANVPVDMEVYEGILNFLAGLSSKFSPRIDLDRKILANAISLVELQFMTSANLSQWAASARSQLNSTGSQGPQQTSGQPSTQGANIENGSVTMIATHAGGAYPEDDIPLGTADKGPGEVCEVCAAPITFTSATSATCQSNHYFTRCSLSFVAIQEPGISMYCAKCGKQFLDPGRIEEMSGPSLSQALFNRFDVCPFCQGKFRG